MMLLHTHEIDKMALSIVERCKAQNIKIATAESCTGGMISSIITSISGSSSIFELGVVVYSNKFKESILGVHANIISEHGAVSKEVAIAMADGILKISGADIGLSVTGIAGPTGGSILKPVGTVYIGLATKDSTQAFHQIFQGDRQEIRIATSKFALERLGDIS